MNLGHIYQKLKQNLRKSTDFKTAADLLIGESGIITSLGDECIDIKCHCLRLLEMGFTPGQKITLIAKSPFKDPLAYSIRGTIIALRSNEAQCIKVQ
jgi:ferrous iron transport protein A